MKHFFFLLLTSVVLFALPACKSQTSGGTDADSKFQESNIRTMWVAPYRKECQGEALQQCMLVSFKDEKPAQGEWELFYDGVQGFTYETGNLYKLKVEVNILKPEHIMQDASDREYKLLEVLRKDGA